MTRILNRVAPRRRRPRWPVYFGAGVVIVIGCIIIWKGAGSNGTEAETAKRETAAPQTAGAPAQPETPSTRTRTTTPTTATRDRVRQMSDEQPLKPKDSKPTVTPDKPSETIPAKEAERKESKPEPTTKPTPVVKPDPPKEEVKPPAGNTAIEAGKKLMEQGKFVEARRRLSSLLETTLSPADLDETLTLLKKIADETVFSKKPYDNDPLVDVYTIQSGDNLTNIGKAHKTPPEIIQTINEIPDPRRIRVGQKIKAPNGPFHAKIYLSKFRLDLYLQDTYLRSYRVAVGKGGGTPTGAWKVRERLLNPTYYPSESATEKRTIAGGEPDNPLGTHWIGLEGVDGDAVGRNSYGIHGTIEPESIGKAVSLGCIRMLNEDVAFVFSVLTRNDSTVTILP